MSNTTNAFFGADQHGQDETAAVLLVDGHHGIYTPQVFAQRFDLREWGVEPIDREILKAGPEHPEYWDAWNDVLMYALCTNADGTWHLQQDMDLWAIKVEG